MNRVEIEPYLYEPDINNPRIAELLRDTENNDPLGNDDVDGAENNEHGDELEEIEVDDGNRRRRRTADLYWCQCGKCELMDIGEECVCCKEPHRVLAKIDDNEVNCITEVGDFAMLCLNLVVLKIGLMTIHDSRNLGPLRRPIPNK